jgi:two-component system chemotaxis response regulator CheY
MERFNSYDERLMAKILVVDDSATVRMLLRKVLDARDGVMGLKNLQENEDIQIIFCDMNMPNMDGLTMCSLVRKEDKYKSIFIFMLTTEAGPQIKKEGQQIGINAWITKPYLATNVLAAVHTVLTRKTSVSK